MNKESKDSREEERKLCLLCGEKHQQEKSHIVPKFIIKKIKSERDSMRMRNAGNPNIVAQDGPKCLMLCPDCEDRFSVWEKHFAETIYHPFYNKKWRRSGELKDEKIVKFLASLTFRTIAHTFQSHEFPTHLERKYRFALNVLSDYLMGRRNSLQPMFFDLYAIRDYSSKEVWKSCSPLYYYVKTGIEYTYLINPNGIYKFVTKIGPFFSAFTIENPYGLDVSLSNVYDGGLMCLCVPIKNLPKDIKDYIKGGLKVVDDSRERMSPHQLDLIRKRWSEYTGVTSR